MAATAPSVPDPLITLSSTASGLEVRGLVEALDACLLEAGIDDDLRGSVTLAVGEALNNIAEHAYAGSDPGPVQMTADLLPDRIRVTLRDSGRVLPGHAVPPAHLPDNSGARDSLPEGGFGWYLIQKLSEEVSYSRGTGQNTLCLSFSRCRTTQ